jgi:hypothetical protein
MILTERRDPRLVSVRRGGTLRDADHQLLALWAADRARRVLHPFDRGQPSDECPRKAIERARASGRGEIAMTQALTAALTASAAAGKTVGAAGEAAHSAGQATAVADVAPYELGGAAYRARARIGDLMLLARRTGLMNAAETDSPNPCGDVVGGGDAWRPASAAWRWSRGRPAQRRAGLPRPA